MIGCCAYHNKITVEESINQMRENVFVILRMTLDAHDVIFISKHLNPSLIRPCNDLCFWWEFSDLTYYNEMQHIGFNPISHAIRFTVRCCQVYFAIIQTSSLWHSITDSEAGTFTDEKSLFVDEKWMAVIPISHPATARPIFPPSERASI